MKPINHLYARICSFENLYQAYLNARKNKRYRSEVLSFSSNLEENLLDIQRKLVNHCYEIGHYRQFIISDPKERLIMALPFEDRIVQWAIYQILNPLFIKSYISTSYGCIAGRGVHSAVSKLQYWLKEVNRKGKNYYYLKLDISKFYYRVDHEVLIHIISKKIADIELIEILKKIINSKDTAFGLPLGMNIEDTDIRISDKGMPIGNLSSQMFANIYLNEIDQFIKRTLHIKYYIRYMDDMIILSDDKELLHLLKNQIEHYLNEKLKLNLNNKTCIRPVTLGIDFVGYKIWNTHIKLRKSTKLRMKRRLIYLKWQYENNYIDLSKVTETVTSYQGLLKHCNSYNFTTKFFDRYVLQRKKTGEAYQNE